MPKDFILYALFGGHFLCPLNLTSYIIHHTFWWFFNDSGGKMKNL